MEPVDKESLSEKNYFEVTKDEWKKAPHIVCVTRVALGMISLGLTEALLFGAYLYSRKSITKERASNPGTLFGRCAEKAKEVLLDWETPPDLKGGDCSREAWFKEAFCADRKWLYGQLYGQLKDTGTFKLRVEKKREPGKPFQIECVKFVLEKGRNSYEVTVQLGQKKSTAWKREDLDLFTKDQVKGNIYYKEEAEDQYFFREFQVVSCNKKEESPKDVDVKN